MFRLNIFNLEGYCNCHSLKLRASELSGALTFIFIASVTNAYMKGVDLNDHINIASSCNIDRADYASSMRMDNINSAIGCAYSHTDNCRIGEVDKGKEEITT